MIYTTASNGLSPLLLPPKPYTKRWNSVSYKSPNLSFPRSYQNKVSLRVANSWKPIPLIKSSTPLGIQSLDLYSSSKGLLDGDCGSLLHTIDGPPKHSTLSISRRAVPYSYKHPPAMSEKPKWWWRTLSCIPYLIPLHLTWICAEGAYVHPSLDYLEFLTFPFLGALSKLPSWFPMAYCLMAYYGIVARKECPHFFRFHVINGMLLESAMQIFGTASKWMPQTGFWGMIGSHIWLVFAVFALLSGLECVRRALTGTYADIPFVSDAAYMHLRYNS